MALIYVRKAFSGHLYPGTSTALPGLITALKPGYVLAFPGSVGAGLSNDWNINSNDQCIGHPQPLTLQIAISSY